MLESGITLFPDLTVFPLHVSCKYKMLMAWINLSHSTETRSVGNKDPVPINMTIVLCQSLKINVQCSVCPCILSV